MIFWYQSCDFFMKLYILKCAFVQYQSSLPDPHWRQSAQHNLILKMVIVMADLEKWSWHCTIKHINSWKIDSYLFLVSYGHVFFFLQVIFYFIFSKQLYFCEIIWIPIGIRRNSLLETIKNTCCITKNHNNNDKY